MTHGPITKGIPALLVALCLGLPTLALAQQPIDQMACMRTYVTCVNSKAPTDYEGKYACVQAYKRNLAALGIKTSPALPGSTPTSIPNRPQTQ